VGRPDFGPFLVLCGFDSDSLPPGGDEAPGRTSEKKTQSRKFRNLELDIVIRNYCSTVTPMTTQTSLFR